MISLPLLKSTIRSQYLIFLIFAAILALYLAIIASMFDPESIEAFDAMLATLPKEIVSAMHFSIHETSLIGFLAGYFYGFLILLFLLIYTAITANHVIASYVDSGSMAFLLSTPNPRWKIALTQAVYLEGSVALLIVFTMLVGIAVSQAMFPGALDIGRFALLNLGTLLLYFALSAIGFFASCMFNETRRSLALGAGLPVLFLLMKLTSGVSEGLAPIGWASLMGLFDPAAIIAGADSVLPSFLALLLIGAALYGAGIMVFTKKDLPL
jgi:beta-exotoxin I transport system permease protein